MERLSRISLIQRMKLKGFTLLELMIAIFILALSVTILLGTQNTSMRMMGYANNTAVVTMLTRAKMQDIEYEVQRQIADEGIKEDYVNTIDGDFRDEGYDDISWSALIQSIELSDDAANNFVESVTNQIYGTGDEDGTLSGNTTITQFLPMMVSFLPTIINQLGQRIRKITLTTTWDYLGVEQTLTVSQFVVVLEVDAASGASGSSVTNSGKEAEDTPDDTNSDSDSKTDSKSKKSGSKSDSKKEPEKISGKTRSLKSHGSTPNASAPSPPSQTGGPNG
ncbi:MAG: prepilin-type N-terminal cleavage/methylation domain-containing protein [Proteobacteria bacterium]|nr:prepilin-type N-terminal cleavage/methylation domain-containing protein [Pseudomonadota bacterium]